MSRNTPNLRDQNDRPVASGVSSSDNTTPVMVRVDPVTGYVLINVSSSNITATPKTWNKRDENHVPTVYGVSSVDGTTLVPIRTTSTGNLLIDFT